MFQQVNYSKVVVYILLSHATGSRVCLQKGFYHCSCSCGCNIGQWRTEILVPFIIIVYAIWADCGQIQTGIFLGASLSFIVKALQPKHCSVSTPHWSRNTICIDFSLIIVVCYVRWNWWILCKTMCVWCFYMHIHNKWLSLIRCSKNHFFIGFWATFSNAQG